MSNDKNREAFEAFAISQYKNISLEREADGDYVRSLAYTQWMFWQASRKQAFEDAASQFNQDDGAWPVAAVINTIKVLK